MIYETEQIIERYSITTDSRFITAMAYLKGLHNGDKPSELMPKDASYLKAARQFYNNLSADDKLIIDSFSDKHTTLDTRQRDKRMSELTLLFIYQMSSQSLYELLLPPKQAEKG